MEAAPGEHRWPVRLLRAAASALALAVVAVLAAAGTAGAHTSLVAASPADGSVTERAPDELRLRFATSVSLRSLQLRLERGDGTMVESLAPGRAADDAADTVVTELPDLRPGVYVLEWVSVGDDGHRATGEVVFGIGAVAIADLRTAGGGSGGFEATVFAGGVARWLFALALAAAVGGLLAVRFARHRAIDGDIGQAVARRGRLVAGIGLAAAAGLLLTRVALVVWSRLSFTSGGPGERLREALTPSLVAAAAAAAVGVFGAAQLRRLQRRAGWFPTLDLVLATLVVLLAVANALVGHAGANELGAPVVVVATVHGLAAATWVGPLVVAGAVALDRRWRAAPAGVARSTAAEAGAAFAPLAAGSFVLLAATGPALALLEGPWSELSGTFRWVLVAKAALVAAVVLPLGALHDRDVGWLARRRGRRPDRLPRRTLAVEVLALVAVLGAGTILATANPLRPLTDGATLLAVVGDPAECADRATGRMSCYRRYFAHVLDTDSAAAAAAELDRLAATTPEVGAQCHQLAHDLGNDAVAALGGVGEALVEAPPTCWSGYYHGVVELAVSGLGAQPTGADLAAVCESLAGRERYSVAHYNCVHGLGHGVMLLADHDLFAALDLCEVVTDEWERTSCYGGAFMERVISIQASPERDDSAGDLLYPCNRVTDQQQLEQCYLMQSSYFLWKLGWDYEAGFELCDQAPESVIDTCYRSMGRDIAANTGHVPHAVLESCRLGADDRLAACVTAAALDAALDALDPAAAAPVCAVLAEADQRSACLGEVALLSFPATA